MAKTEEIQVKKFNKGEILFPSEKNRKNCFYIIQSGLVSISLKKNDQTIVIGQATSPQLIGEDCLINTNDHRGFCAVAVNHTEALEVPSTLGQDLINSAPGPLKLLIKSLLNKQIYLKEQLLEAKSKEQNNELFPKEVLSRLFAVLYYSAKSIGKEKNSITTVVWSTYKKYAHWGFAESPTRLDKIIIILSKIGALELEMVESETDPEDPPELGFVHFKNLEILKSFYEFFLKYKDIGMDSALSDLQDAIDPQLKLIDSLLMEIKKENASAFEQNKNKTSKT